MSEGIILVSHVLEMGVGLRRLLKEVAQDVPISVAAGLEQGEIGTSFEKILEEIEQNPANSLLAFYDLGSGKMNLELAAEMTEKQVLIVDTAFVEGAYTAAALLQVDTPMATIKEQLASLTIKG